MRSRITIFLSFFLGVVLLSSCSKKSSAPTLEVAAEPTPSPIPSPIPSPTQFNEEPLLILDYDGYKNVCAYPSELQPSIQSVIPININNDDWTDFIVHQWCDLYRDNFGNIIETPTPDLIVVHLSNDAGFYRNGAEEVFGEPLPSLGGASRKYSTGDLNGDGRIDIAFAMNWEDGRNGNPWENSRTRPAVILSKGESQYEIHQLGIPDWGHAVAMVINSEGTYDALFAGFTGIGLQAFRYNNEAFIDVKDEYPPEAIWDENWNVIENGSANWASEFKSHNDLIIATHESIPSEVESRGFALWRKVNEAWVKKDKFMIPVEFYVDQISWQGSTSSAAVYLLDGEHVLGFTPETMCFFEEKVDDSGKIAFLALFATNKHKYDIPIIEGQTYNDSDFNVRQVVKFFHTDGNSIEEAESPFNSFDEYLFANFMDCKDLNDDGYADYARNVFSRTYGYEESRDRGGTPILNLNNKLGEMIEYEDNADYLMPGHSLLQGDNINDGAGHGQGYFHDVNGDGIIDIVVFGETMRNEFNNYDGSIEIYLGNFDLELTN